MPDVHGKHSDTPDVHGKPSGKQAAALLSLSELRALRITKLLCHHLRTGVKHGGRSSMHQARECVWGQSREREQAFIYCLSIIPKGKKPAVGHRSEGLLFWFIDARYQTQDLTEAGHTLHQ